MKWKEKSKGLNWIELNKKKKNICTYIYINYDQFSQKTSRYHAFENL